MAQPGLANADQVKVDRVNQHRRNDPAIAALARLGAGQQRRPQGDDQHLDRAVEPHVQFGDQQRIVRTPQLAQGQRLSMLPGLRRRGGVNPHRGPFELEHFIIALTGRTPVAVAMVENETPQAILTNLLPAPVTGGNA